MQNKPIELKPGLQCAEGPGHVARLIEQLGSRDMAEAAAAEIALQNAGSEVIVPLVDALQREKRTQNRIFLVAIVYSVVSTLFMWLLETWHAHIAVRTLYPGVFVGAGSMLICLPAIRASRRQKRIIKLLAAAEDRNALPQLIDALKMGDSSDVVVRRTAAAGLVQLLPQLRPADAKLLGGPHHSNLHSALLGDNKQLTLAILSALEQVGDNRDLSTVEKICSADREVMEAAKVCLQRLLERAGQKRVSDGLLRASVAPVTGPDVLLRPASGQEDTAASDLLRASSAGDDRS